MPLTSAVAPRGALADKAADKTRARGQCGLCALVGQAGGSATLFRASPGNIRSVGRDGLREIDVAAQTRFPGGIQDARGGSQKIIAVAGDKQAVTLAGQPQYLVIRRGGGPHFTQLDDHVAQCFQ
jgi:hypothetical protein